MYLYICMVLLTMEIQYIQDINAFVMIKPDVICVINTPSDDMRKKYILL